MGREAREKEIRARIDADAQSLQKQLQDAMSQAIMLQQKVAMAEAKRASDAAAEDLARKDWEAKATESVRIERSRSRSRSGSPIQTAISLMDDRGTRDLSSAKMGAQMALESLPRRSGGSINGVNVEQRMMRAGKGQARRRTDGSQLYGATPGARGALLYGVWQPSASARAFPFSCPS